MIQLDGRTVEDACRQFAEQLIEELVYYDIDAIRKLIDVNESSGPLEQSFLPPPLKGDGSYCLVEDAANWHFQIEPDGEDRFQCHFGVPFHGDYEPLVADFAMERSGANALRARFFQLGPG